MRPRKHPARAKWLKSREPKEESSPRSQISRRVRINLALDPSILCFHGSDPCVLQKRRRMIEYDSNTEKLERMMVVVGGDANPEEGVKAEHKAPPSVMGQPESRDPISEIEVLRKVMYPEDTSKVVVLREAVPLEDTYRSVLSVEEPILGVARVGEVSAADDRSSELAFV